MGDDQRQRAAERACVDARALRVLRPASYKVLGALRHFTDEDGYCWPSVKKLMEKAGPGVRDRHTLFHGLRELQRKRFVWRAKLVSLKTRARTVSLYRVGARVEKLPVRAREWGLTLVGRKHTTPRVNSPHYPPGRPNRTTLVGKTPTDNSSHINLPIEKESPLPSEEATLRAVLDEEKITNLLMKELSGHQPSISRDAVRQAVRLATLLASSPPRSVNYYREAVPDVISHFPEKLASWLIREAVQLLEERDWSYQGGAADLKEVLKQHAAEQGLSYDAGLVANALDCAERRLREQSAIRSELALGRQT